VEYWSLELQLSAACLVIRPENWCNAGQASLMEGEVFFFLVRIRLPARLFVVAGQKKTGRFHGPE
jgi:hypothetical protein